MHVVSHVTHHRYGEMPYKAEVAKLEDVRQFVLDGKRLAPPKVRRTTRHHQ